MVQNHTVEVKWDVTLSSDSIYGGLINELDGLLLILRKKREDGRMSSQKEPSNEDMELGMQRLQSQENTETSTEHGPEVRSSEEWECCESSDGQHHVNKWGVCNDCHTRIIAYDGRGRANGDDVMGPKKFPEPQFEGQTGHPDTYPDNTLSNSGVWSDGDLLRRLKFANKQRGKQGEVIHILRLELEHLRRNDALVVMAKVRAILDSPDAALVVGRLRAVIEDEKGSLQAHDIGG